jgi:release factor glutamine methyltransferase
MLLSIDAAIADARTRLRAAGIAADEAALDARLMAQHVLGWDSARLMTHGDEPASEDFQAGFAALLRRRERREPMAHLTGSREFWNLDIEVTAAVLVPRPETELLVEAALERFDRRRPLHILDVCTGSGCVAAALGTEFTASTLVVTDLSREALEVAGRNLARHGLAARTRIVETDLVAGITEHFSLVVANPPYIPTSDAPGLQPEVRFFEPAAALFAGADGLDIVRRLLSDVPRVLEPDGLLIFEFGHGQLEAIRAACADVPSLTLLDVRHDLQNIPRIAIVRRS